MTLYWARVKRFDRSENAFTLVELLIVIGLMSLILAVGVVVYYGASRSTDLKAAAEILKQDIRKVYAATDSGESVTDATGVVHKAEYKMEFHLNGDSPANCYCVWTRSWGPGGTYGGWTLVPPDKHSSNITMLNQWIKLSTSSDIQIASVSNPGAGGNQITFKAMGSIIQTDATGDATVTISSKSQKKDFVINVSMFGSIE